MQINFAEPAKGVRFSMYNMIGAEIKNIRVEKVNDRQFNFNFQNLHPGFYFLRIQTDKFNYTTRITVTAALPQKRSVPSI